MSTGEWIGVIRAALPISRISSIRDEPKFENTLQSMKELYISMNRFWAIVFNIVSLCITA